MDESKFTSMVEWLAHVCGLGNRGQIGDKARTYSSIPLPPARLHLIKVPQPQKTLAPLGNKIARIHNLMGEYSICEPQWLLTVLGLYAIHLFLFSVRAGQHRL